MCSCSRATCTELTVDNDNVWTSINRTMLSFHFRVLTAMGVWCPVDWPTSWKFSYKFYSIAVICLMYSLGFSQLARVIFVRQNFDEFNDAFFILLATNFACFKAACDLLHQRQILQLRRMFERECCVPRDEFERDLMERYDAVCKKIAVSLLAMVELSALFVVGAPLASNNIESRELPYKVLLPYSLSNPLVYWLTYAHHCCGAVLLATITLTNDAIITGFMLQLTGQLKVLQHRFEELPSNVVKNNTRMHERQLLRECVQYHVHIFEVAEFISTTFYDIIVCQFGMSALAICVSVYQLSTRANNAVELLNYALFLVSLLGQFFVYCYFGNELTWQGKRFSDSMFNIDRTPLSLELKKNLVFVLQRSSKPIKISCGAFVQLTLESFVNIVKMSYSVFSVLKSSA